MLVLHQIDESVDETGDESQDKNGDGIKDSVPQSKVNYACTFPLQGVVMYILPIEALICDQDQYNFDQRKALDHSFLKCLFT